MLIVLFFVSCNRLSFHLHGIVWSFWSCQRSQNDYDSMLLDWKVICFSQCSSRHFAVWSLQHARIGRKLTLSMGIKKSSYIVFDFRLCLAFIPEGLKLLNSNRPNWLKWVRITFREAYLLHLHLRLLSAEPLKICFNQA